MPLLMCPNCNAGMQSVQRSGIEFDMCPACRGVWLDRGELESLMAAARGGDQPAAPGPAAPPPVQSRPYRERDDDDWDDRRRGDHGYGDHRKRKRGLDIFDIFD